MKLNKRVCKQTTITETINLTGKDILEMLGLGQNASVQFRVPGGGDWSHTDIDIDEDCPVVVTVVSTTFEDEKP